MKSSHCKCGEHRRQGATNCVTCHAASMREYRKTHKLTTEQRKKDNCRSYAGVYLRRGKILKQNCEVCDSEDSQMHHPDYSKPLEVIWICRKHHLQLHDAEAA